MKDETRASPFAALFQWERKFASSKDGKAKVQVEAQTSKLRLGGGPKGARFFHKGHRLAGTRINNVVKVKYVKNNRDARRHIMAHLDYIQNREREVNEPKRKFYGKDGERSREDVVQTMMKNRAEKAAMFKLILSPKQNELNLVDYSQEIMRRFEEKSGIFTDWSLVEHRNTDYHHVHIVLPGLDKAGSSYRLEREHLDLLRELANEYQYELQDRVYQAEKQVEQEFGLTREEAGLLVAEKRIDRGHRKELGIEQPKVDEQVREDLLKPTGFDPVYFASKLQDEKEETAREALTLMDLARHPDREERGEEHEEKDQDEKIEQKERAESLSGDAKVLADRFRGGQDWAGLTGFNHPNFKGEVVDLRAEANMLLQHQQELSKEMMALDLKVELTDQIASKIEEATGALDDELKDHEKEQEENDRG